MGVRVRASKRRVLARLDAPGCEPERILKTAIFAEYRIFRDQSVVDRSRAQWARGGQLFVWKADAEAARVILAHLGVGVGQRRPIAESGDVHAPDVVAWIALDHPVGERETDAASLAETGHHAAGDPKVLQSLHGSDQRVAVRRERKRPVDDLADARFAEIGKMLERRLQARRDAIEIVGQQILAEIPRRFALAPGLARLFVRAD